jgi:hypothetical protein
MANRGAAAGKLTVAETFSSLREQGKVRAFEPSRSRFASSQPLGPIHPSTHISLAIPD